MEDQHTLLDNDSSEYKSSVEPQEIISLPVFIFLCVLTLGLYQIWWSYKAWRFFKQKEQSDIMPAARAIFSLFFLLTLFEKIKTFGAQKGASLYSSAILFIGIVIISFLGYMPAPYSLISLLSVLFFVPPFEVLNYAKLKSSDLVVHELHTLNARQIGLVIGGVVFWILIVIGLMNPEAEGLY